MPIPNFSGDPPSHLITEPLLSFTPLKLQNGDLRMAIAVAGQHAYNSYGEEATLTEEFLSKDFKTWESGLISTNHENTNDLLGGATLYDLEYDSEKKLVIASFAGLPEMAKKFIQSEFYQGLSQECIPLSFMKDSLNVIRGYGTGVTIVMWPHSPAASPEMGVGVRPALAAILSYKYPSQKIEDTTMTDKPGDGKPVVSVEAFESSVSENVMLKSTIKGLELKATEQEKEIVSWKQKYNELESGEAKRLEIAIAEDRAKRDAELKAIAEREAVVSELKTVMSKEAAESYLSTNPTIEQIKSISGILKATAATGVGSSVSKAPDENGRSFAELDSEWNSKLGRA